MANGLGSVRSRMNFNPKCFTYVFGCYEKFMCVCVSVVVWGSLLDDPKRCSPAF